MTVYEIMRKQALDLFDATVLKQEQAIRADLRDKGATPHEIDRHIEACQPNLEAQRREIGRLVATEMAKAGVPLEVTADVWN